MMHYYLIKYFGTDIEYSHNWLYVFMGAIWSVLCCFVIALCLNRFAPILVGKKKKS